MIREKPTGHVKITVCLIEVNPLAARELARCLLKGLGIHALSLTTPFNACTPSVQPTVYIIDRCSLFEEWKKITRRLRSVTPKSRILIVDVEFSKAQQIEALTLGADGCLPYRDIPTKLIKAVRALAKGRMWTSVQVLEDCLRNMSRLRNPAAPGRLTGREKEVVTLIQKRLPNHKIAEILGITNATVKFHLMNLYSKLEVLDRLSAIEAIESELHLR